MLWEKLESVRFYFKLLGVRGGINFLVGLMRCGKEKIYSVDLAGRHLDYSALINPESDFRFIENLEQYDSIAPDYAAVKGKALAARDRERIASGKEYLSVIHRQGQFAGWGWARKGPLRYGNCQLTEADCVIHKCRTLRDHRGQGVYVTLLVSLQDALANKGFQRAYIGAKSFNKASLRGIEKAGFEFIEECNLGSFASRALHHFRGKGPKVMQSSD